MRKSHGAGHTTGTAGARTTVTQALAPWLASEPTEKGEAAGLRGRSDLKTESPPGNEVGRTAENPFPDGAGDRFTASSR